MTDPVEDRATNPVLMSQSKTATDMVLPTDIPFFLLRPGFAVIVAVSIIQRSLWESAVSHNFTSPIKSLQSHTKSAGPKGCCRVPSLTTVDKGHRGEQACPKWVLTCPESLTPDPEH